MYVTIFNSIYLKYVSGVLGFFFFTEYKIKLLNMFEKLLFYLKKITELRNYKLMRQNRNTFVYKRKHNNLGDFRTI